MKIKTLTYPSVLLLILVNSIPIFGILFLEWNIFSILFLYWLESIVIGFFNILKMYAIEKEKAIPLIILFIIHYGGFNFVHLVFIISFFAPKNIFIGNFILDIGTFFDFIDIIILALIPLFISHGTSLFLNFFKEKEYLKTRLIKQMNMPYKRVVVMHLSIIFSGFFISTYKQGTIIIVLLVLLKIIFDALGHIAEHNKTFKKIYKI